MSINAINLPRGVLEPLLRGYFFQGMENEQIRDMLRSEHHIEIAEATLVRRLRFYGMTRHPKQTPETFAIIKAIVTEGLKGAQRDLGYRNWRQCLLVEHELETMRVLLNELSPERVQQRKARRLRRRTYSSRGPMHAVHCDQWDKLKPFGFPVIGAVDGFSRKIMYMRVVSSNNDSRQTVTPFLEMVGEQGAAPSTAFFDPGTENARLKRAQRFFTQLAWNAVRIGSSKHNVKIEMMWGQLRRLKMQFFIDLLKVLEEQLQINFKDKHERMLVRFVFLPFIEGAINDFVRMWNSHRIRASPNTPGGRPNVLFATAFRSGHVNCGVPVQPEAVAFAARSLQARTVSMVPADSGSALEQMKALWLAERGLNSLELAHTGEFLMFLLLHKRRVMGF